MGLFSRFKRKKDNKNVKGSEPILEKVGPNHYKMHASEMDDATYKKMKKDYDQFVEMFLKASSNNVEIKKEDIKAEFDKISNNSETK